MRLLPCELIETLSVDELMLDFTEKAKLAIARPSLKMLRSCALVSAVVPATVGKLMMAVVTSIINGYLGVVMMGSFMAYYLSLAANTEKKAV